MGEWAEIFKFAAKAGSLEGYSYEREKLDPLSNWVSNIEDMYQNLPDNVKKDIKGEYGTVLARSLKNGERVLGDEIKSRLIKMLSELRE